MHDNIFLSIFFKKIKIKIKKLRTCQLKKKKNSEPRDFKVQKTSEPVTLKKTKKKHVEPVQKKSHNINSHRTH